VASFLWQELSFSETWCLFFFLYRSLSRLCGCSRFLSHLPCLLPDDKSKMDDSKSNFNDTNCQMNGTKCVMIASVSLMNDPVKLVYGSIWLAKASV
jgi:hypothetical protein